MQLNPPKNSLDEASGTPKPPPTEQGESFAPSPASAPRLLAPGHLAPPPPSARPLSARPTAPTHGALPPPISMRPGLPKAPPVARVEAVPDTGELKRLEEENHSLRKRLATQRDELRVEQRNIELLRKELALVKTRSAPPPAAPLPAVTGFETPTPAPLDEQIRSLTARHERDLIQLRSAHREELARLASTHQKALAEQKSAFESKANELQLAQSDQLAQSHQLGNSDQLGNSAEPHPAQAERAQAERPSSTPPAQKEGSDEMLSPELRAQLADLQERNAAFRQKNTELREKNGALENKLRELTLSLPASSVTSLGDDLSVLKGIGPATLKALQSLGVTTFREIATWSDADIESIAPKIKSTAARIRKNGWVEVATRIESLK